MSRKGAETQRDAHCFTLTRWVSACLSASASSLRLCAFARHPIAGFRFIVVTQGVALGWHVTGPLALDTRPCCLRMVKMCWRKLSCLLPGK
jgi:hypothetical protein